MEGFTLIELMITVVIVAVLAGVALVAYTRHLHNARLVDARAFLAAIQARQETYFQRFGWYANASGTPVNYYPQLGNNHCVGGDSGEPCAKGWNMAVYPVPAGWNNLGAHPEKNTTYFEWLVIASNPATQHAFGSDIHPALLGIPPQPTTGVSPHPWFYAIGRADLNGSGVPCGPATCTILYSTSARSEIVSQFDGQ